MKYYDKNEVNELKIKEKDFGIMHLNIVSLNQYIDDLINFLAQLSFKFLIIGLSELKTCTNIPFNNIEISGYVFCYDKTKSSL